MTEFIACDKIFDAFTGILSTIQMKLKTIFVIKSCDIVIYNVT